MAGYIGSSASVVTSGAERKKVYSITSTTTSLTGASYTPNFVHVFHNGVRLVDGTDYTATDGNTITLTTAAENGDEVVVVSYATFQTSDTVSASAGGTFSNDVAVTGDFTVDTNTLHVDSTNNRVGVGTSSPSVDLHISSSAGSLRLEDSDLGHYGGMIQSGGALYIDADFGGTAGVAGNMRFRVAGGTEAMRIDASGNVGIGTSSPASLVHANNTSGDAAVRVTSSDTGYAQLFLGDQTSGSQGRLEYYNGNNSMGFYTAGSERMRIDASGNVLLGTTSTPLTLISTSSIEGIGLEGNTPYVGISRAAGIPLYLNRLISDGDIMHFRKDGTTVGSIGNAGSRPYIASTQHGLYFGSTATLPTNGSGAPIDNTYDFGVSTYRWDDIYATNGTIQTSDRNEKQQIASLTAAEMQAAKTISALFKTFKWNDKVAEKGDAARKHTGVIAQDVQQAMADAGLDAGDYAFFISSTWWETQTEVPAVEAVAAQDAVYDEEGNLISEAVDAVEAQEAYTRTDTYDTLEEAPEGATERTRLGIRYPELLAFIGAATEQRLASIEARLDALEGV